MDLIEKMWEVLTTLSDEAQVASLAKCSELGFDPNRGEITLDESFINLKQARSILIDAIQKKKLIQLPITIQKTLLSHLESISRFLSSMTGGTDEVVNLVNSIEQLDTAIWQFGFYNLSNEVLGYLEKMNQLKKQELALIDLQRKLEEGIQKKADLEKVLEDATAAGAKIEESAKASEESTEGITDNLTKTTETEQKAAALLATIQQNEATSSKLLASTQTSNSSVLALEPKIKEFFEEIDEYREKITSTSEEAKKTVDTNNVETGKILARLNELEDQIKVQIQKATGFSLFHSFQTRQLALAKSKRYWAGALVVLVLASLGVTYFVISTHTEFDVAFYLKLSLSLPLIYAIAFCTVQYSRERKLEEEYAFKSNISISLVPYKDLVEKLIDKQQPQDKERFNAFIIDSITKVFTSPTDKIFESEGKPRVDSDKAIKHLGSAIKAIVEPLKPFLDAIKH
ncbi:MAG: hypothetical protein HY707_00545 [Ignavibacteriae bacterium]|nr:hypothetical protein [Ignavibacteriota bacterium]